MNSYGSLGERGAPFVFRLTYEELVADPGAITRRIRDEFGLEMAVDEFTNIEDSTKTKVKDFNHYQEYYLKEKWKERKQWYMVILSQTPIFSPPATARSPEPHL